MLSYLTAANEALLEFASCGGIFGRQKERCAIESCFREKGTMALVCGGTSVGKTRLMDKVIKDMSAGSNVLSSRMEAHAGGKGPMKIVHFDGRAADSLLNSLREKVFQLKIAPGMKAEVNVSGVKVTMPLTLSSNVAAVADYVVVVLDEANLFLRSPNAAEENDIVKLFDTLVMYTKQKMYMSAVLLSADEGLLFRLADKGIRSTHLKSTLVVCGACPSEILAQLQELRVGLHLRELLVRIYGGHVWQISAALSQLRMEVQLDTKSSIWSEPMGSIQNALTTWVQEGGDKKELVSVLEEVARCGFYPLASKDKRARALTEANLCTFLTDGAKEFFIDPAVRQHRSGVTASSQLVRVLIPVVLRKFNADFASSSAA